MLIDLHAHTSAISHCARADAEAVVKLAHELGYDGLALANHYTHNYYTPETYDAWIAKYIAEWNHFAEIGNAHKMRIFCAIEVTMEYEPRLHMLIYGADETFLRENRELCEMSHAELFALCEEHDCALVQAHPFRNGATVQDTSLLHGLEINCHPGYGDSCARRVIDAASDAHLSLTVGCDWHNDTYRPHGGTFVPDEIDSDRALAKWIRESQSFSLKVHEPKDGSIYTLDYTK